VDGKPFPTNGKRKLFPRVE